ncbi:MAG: DUF692 domain-containing protein [Acidobacteria bacterium]|nr:DUF692 domain-containing protein [Acidobacteriota bacterium]MBI3488734.1 DUF692 domain-containing protein [Acidobacteriota bacterium]
MARDRFTGVGLGLRRPHLEQVAGMEGHGVPFWETCPENVVGDGGRAHRLACAILDRDPVLTHGLAMSVGGYDPWDEEYLQGLEQFLLRTGTPWHSEHLCFTSVDANCLHELFPLPFTREAARHTISRARELQARLPVPLLLENITYYAGLGEPDMDEADFIAAVLEGADVGWLLDVNNVYVNALNFGFDPKEWLSRMPLDRVAQMHIAGHKKFGGLTVDTHGADVIDPVIELMQWTLARLGRPVPVLLERDNHIPSLDALLAERERIQRAYDQVLASTEAGHA